jgi:hypothetical protein
MVAKTRRSNTQLHQIVAILPGKKTRVKKDLETRIYHILDRAPAVFNGLTKVYTPAATTEDGEQPSEFSETRPAETVLVQMTAEQVVDELTTGLADLIDTVATMDRANCLAKADVKVGDRVICEQVPVTTLMMLEKELSDLASVVGRFPTLDPAISWRKDPARGEDGVYVSDVVESNSGKKIPKVVTLAPPTKEHPAQVTMVQEDVVVGRWALTKFSGAMTPQRVAGIKQRIEILREAVKFAREEANNITVEDVSYGEEFLNFVFKEEGGA